MMRVLFLLIILVFVGSCGPQKKRKDIRDKKFIASLKEEGGNTLSLEETEFRDSADGETLIFRLQSPEYEAISDEEFFKLMIQKPTAGETENEEKVFKKNYDVKLEDGSPGKYYIREDYLEEGKQFKRWASYDGKDFVELAVGFWAIEGVGNSARFRKYISGSPDTTCVRNGILCITCYQQSVEETLCLK